jgi:hypothetical protein
VSTSDLTRWYFVGNCDDICREVNRSLVIFGVELFLEDGVRRDDFHLIKARAVGRNREQTDLVNKLLQGVASKDEELVTIKRNNVGKDALVFRLLDHLRYLRDRMPDDVDVSGLAEIDDLLAAHAEMSCRGGA